MRFFEIFSSPLRHWVTYCPGPLGNWIRYRYYRKRLRFLGQKARIDFGVHIINPSLVSIGENTHIDRHVTLGAGALNPKGRKVVLKSNPESALEPGEILIGKSVHIAPWAYLVGAGGIRIGDNSGIAAGAKIFTVSNHYRNPAEPDDKTAYSFSNRAPAEKQLLLLGPAVMNENSALGLNSILLPGATIGRNSWVGIQSYVTGEIPPDCIASGCPAKVIRERNK